MADFETQLYIDEGAVLPFSAVRFDLVSFNNWVDHRLAERAPTELGTLALHLADANSIEAKLAPGALGMHVHDSNAPAIKLFMPRIIERAVKTWPEPDSEMQGLSISMSAGDVLVHETEHWLDSFFYPQETFEDPRRKRFLEVVGRAKEIYEKEGDFTDDDAKTIIAQVFDGVVEYMSKESYQEYSNLPHEVRAREAVAEFQRTFHPPVLGFTLKEPLSLSEEVTT